MIRFLSVAVLLATSPAPAQDGPRRFDVGRFDAVELASADRVRILPGTAVSVIADGDPRAVAALAITVRNGTLSVGRTPGIHRGRGATVTVTMPSLRAASLSGSGSIGVNGVAAPAFVGRLGGSGSMALAGLKAASVRLDLSGSGSIAANGTADTLAIRLGGSGQIDTRRLATPALTVDLGGSGAVAAAASRTAVVIAGGSGSVRVTGGPRCTVRKSGSASVRCA